MTKYLKIFLFGLVLVLLVEGDLFTIVLAKKKMSLEEGTLIEIIQKFPHLWDKKDPRFKDKIAIENSWKTISEIMRMTVEECQDTWKSIRLKFIRERRLLKNLPSGSGAYSCSWPLYEKLGFLNAVVSTRKTKGNIKKQNETLSTPSDVWDDISIVEDGEVYSEVTGDTDFEMSQEVLSTDFEMSKEVLSETETSQNIESVPQRTLSNITNVPKTTKVSNTTNVPNFKEKQARKRKSDVPLEQLVETCTSVGKSLNSFFKSPSYTESSIGKDDYYFGLSVAESISKIKHNKKKLGIKAEIFVMISDATD